MLSKHFEPVEEFGRKFDRGMTLFEFDAFREPEKTYFPKIGEWLKERMAFNEIDTPQMMWRGRFWPDLYIANQLDALRDTDFGIDGMETFNAEFIEPMCRKITGRSYAEMETKYHRALWLPLYWPETVRERKSLRTPYWYPKHGYAGVVRTLFNGGKAKEAQRNTAGWLDTVELSLAFLVAKPRHPFTVMFIVDDTTSIYRVTDMDACAGIDTEFHRFIVEFPSAKVANVFYDMRQLWLAEDARYLAFKRISMPLPTKRNVAAGWKPAPNMNEQIWTHLNTPH